MVRYQRQDRWVVGKHGLRHCLKEAANRYVEACDWHARAGHWPRTPQDGWSDPETWTINAGLTSHNLQEVH